MWTNTLGGQTKSKEIECGCWWRKWNRFLGFKNEVGSGTLDILYIAQLWIDEHLLIEMEN